MDWNAHGKYIVLGVSVIAGFFIYKKVSPKLLCAPEPSANPQLIKAMNFATQQ